MHNKRHSRKIREGKVYSSKSDKINETLDYILNRKK